MISRKLSSGLVAALVILFFSTDALAQKGGSSSSSSGSRSYSSGSSSSSSSSGRSYSSGSTSKPSTSTPSSTAGRSYSSGSTNKPTATANSSTPGKSYSSGNSGTTSSGTSSSSRPAQPKFDTLAREDKFKADNRAQYQKSSTPQSSYKTSSGQAKNIDSSSKTVQTTRNNITEEKWVNRSTRINTTFNNYTVIGGGPGMMVYHDPYNTFFWLWLLDRSADERAMWAYHHQSDLDARRIEELRRKDAELDARLKRLEGKPRNANYTPSGLDEDLMYTDDYVEAVYNPSPKAYPHSTSHGGDWPFKILGSICLWTCLLGLIGFAIYLVFFYRKF